jgi:hypothetical protein
VGSLSTEKLERSDFGPTHCFIPLFCQAHVRTHVKLSNTRSMIHPKLLRYYKLRASAVLRIFGLAHATI